ncbi:MAG: aminotransferase class III-fold pyridoxal phosphate-dependent enzyme [Chloroflexota bacterium]
MSSQSIKFLDRNTPKVSVDEAKQIARGLFGLEGTFKSLSSERDQNFRVTTARPELVEGADATSYVFKIANADEDEGVIDFQTQALRHIEKRDPSLAVPRVVLTKTGEPYTTIRLKNGDEHIVRVLTYVPGVLIDEVAKTAVLRRSLGQFLGKLDLALRGFFHPHARHELLWDVTRCLDLAPHAVHIEDAKARANVEAIMARMETAVLPQLSTLRHQIIHNDAHASNTLADPANHKMMAGLLDFGDMIFGPLVLEVVIAVDPVRIPAADRLASIAALVAGFDDVFPLEAEEIDLIYDLILARLAINACIVAWRRAMTPQQPAYLADTEQALWDTIEHLIQIGRATVSDALRAACRFPVYSHSDLTSLNTPDVSRNDSNDLDKLLERRRNALGKHLAHFYTRPVHLERGSGPWLYSPDGTRYLDAYNNVPTVGHSHPHVAKAIARQTAVLNTNTRYIYRSILDYAERLLSTLPDHISVCAFVNSGSEANDVAFRMAQFVTGNKGALIVENAYHGITESIKYLSPSGRPLPAPHVRTLLSPNPYRGKYRYGEPDLAEKYAADTDRAIAELAEAGMKPAAYMIDSLFVSNGSPDVPEGYLTAVSHKIRAAGGLFIADEVQAGFGRSGDHLWGHVAHGVHADIVTMGKPVGNGFPLGVIATTPEILNAFVGHVGLFSTFGGNPVACAAGTAVLDVIENENLVVSAKETGDYLRDSIRSLMDRYDIIGDVRGRGLLTGVDLVQDRTTKEPATAATKRLLDLMRDNGVLIGKGDVGGNVLKIRPPLAFKKPHADIFVEALDKSLAAL